MKVSVREFKSHLSEYLRRAEAGEEIEVLSRNRLVARLLPPTGRSVGAATEESAIEALRALPWIRPARTGKRQLPEPLVQIPPGSPSLSQMVSEDRR